MSLLISDIKMPIEADIAELSGIIARKLSLPAGAVKAVRVIRQSLDARRKGDIHFKVSAVATLEPTAQSRILKLGLGSLYDPPEKYELITGNATPKGRIVIAGLGPAGLFCAYFLAKAGYKPLIIERGKDVDKRKADVERFFEAGKLDTASNVAFGEGGAGTFSDGKLTSRSKNPRANAVLEALSEHGAPHDINYAAKPHVGTDVLMNVVKSMRNEILSNGGEIRFETRLEDIMSEDGVLTAVSINHNGISERVEAAACVLAVGQAAGDVYTMLLRKGAMLEARPYAVGVRIEHPQALIDKAQFGAFAGHPRLGAAEYALTARCANRGVYTFCMCPGGQVVAATSDEGQTVTNGMSYRSRNGENANSAILVQIKPEDYAKGSDPLSGLYYRDELEKRAYALGGGDYIAPAQRVCDFISKNKGTGFYDVNPTYRPGVSPQRLDELLPDFVYEGIKEGLSAFARQLKGFDLPDAVLTAIESRSSAPVRIIRDNDMQMPSIRGVYPVGEGAGYAGGIMSAAIDGMMAAERIASSYKPGR